MVACCYSDMMKTLMPSVVYFIIPDSYGKKVLELPFVVQSTNGRFGPIVDRGANAAPL